LETYKGQPLLEFESTGGWLLWLSENHDKHQAVWLKLAKKNSKFKTLSYEEARDTAIAFGWIDGLINRFDDLCYVTRFTPRSKKSGWSKVNCAVAEALIASKNMSAAGLAQVEAAKMDGRWGRAYDSSSTIATPADFQAALDDSPQAKTFFVALNSANRYAFLYRIQTAASPKSRGERIRKYVQMLEAGEVFHP
jgi:uncharacterized protein YdeI (YjbR/CyaY-like superfamily)